VDLASLLVEIDKKVFPFGFGVLCGCGNNGACFRAFLAELSWPWAPTEKNIFWHKFFWNQAIIRVLEPLIGLIVYLEPKLWLKKQKLGKTLSHKKGNLGHFG